MKKFHKETFDKISEEKREKILDAAINEFARKGYNAANVNTIAKNAGVSIGSIYNYFATKEDIALTILDKGYSLLDEVFSGIDLVSGDIFDKIEKLIRAAQKYSRKYPQITQMYLDISSEGLAHLSDKLSMKLESISARFYQSIITESIKEGIVDSSLDPEIASFCLDNIILVLQYSYSSQYFKERIKIFAGDDIHEQDEKVVQGMMRFIRNAFSPRND